MTSVGAYDPATARLILDVVRYLTNNGFVIDARRGNRQTIRPQELIYVKNVSGEVIPAYACMQATGTVEYGDQTYIEVEKPADITGAAGGFLFNGPAEIPVAGYGVGFDGPVVRMLTDGSTVTAGNRWRPTVGAFTVEPGEGPFIAGGDDNIKPNVMKGFVASTGGNPVWHAMTKSGGINSRSTLTMGSATCDLYVSSSGGVLSDSGTDVTVYNPFSQSVAGERHILISKNEAGLWVVIAEDCG